MTNGPTIAEIIEAAGGAAEIARRQGLDRTTVGKWRENGIPHRRWPDLIEHGVTLSQIHAANLAAQNAKAGAA